MKVLVVYYSTYGNVYKMAQLVAKGIRQVPGAAGWPGLEQSETPEFARCDFHPIQHLACAMFPISNPISQLGT